MHVLPCQRSKEVGRDLDKLKDPEIRALLKQKISSQSEFILDPTTVVIDEFNICFGAAIMDVAVVNGKIHGYEIKSERDNLDRLPSQMEYYNKVFDTVTLVISDTHLMKARKIVPRWWGIDCIVTSKSKVSIKTVRKPGKNKNVNVFELTQLLWKEELLELLEKNNIVKGTKSKTRMQLCTMSAERIDHNQIIEFVRNKLKTRKAWRAVPIQQLCDGLQLS